MRSKKLSVRFHVSFAASTDPRVPPKVIISEIILLTFKIQPHGTVNALTIYTLINFLKNVLKRAKQTGHHNETYDAVIAAFKAMQHSIAELLSEEGLTQPQFITLSVIAKNGSMPMRGISDEMLVTPANITGIIDRLEHKGLIKRMARPGDRRATIIDLTHEGRTMQERVALRYSEFMQKALQAFTMDEQKTLRHLLEKLQQEMSRLRGMGCKVYRA
ncbi:MAG: MarR family transcriptional regulator [Nitrososphaeria archaeon]